MLVELYRASFTVRQLAFWQFVFGYGFILSYDFVSLPVLTYTLSIEIVADSMPRLHMYVGSGGSPIDRR